MQLKKRQLVALISTIPLIAACQAINGRPTSAFVDEGFRFHGVGLVLVTDAVPGSEMRGVELYADQSSTPFYTSSVLALRNREIMSYPGGNIPRDVRALWRDNSTIIRRPEGGGNTYAGRVLGDYSTKVSDRIPDELLREIRANGGSLRLKFRLTPDALLFGWDIERAAGGVSRFEMAGGDFREAKVFNGKIIEQGWYIDKNGRKILTDG